MYIKYTFFSHAPFRELVIDDAVLLIKLLSLITLFVIFNFQSICDKYIKESIGRLPNEYVWIWFMMRTASDPLVQFECQYPGLVKKLWRNSFIKLLMHIILFLRLSWVIARGLSSKSHTFCLNLCCLKIWPLKSHICIIWLYLNIATKIITV